MTPMFHVHAWGIPYLATLLGVKQVYPGRYEPEMLLKLIAAENVTFSHCVPTILHMLLSSPAAKKVDLSSWKVIIGGSALPKGLCRAALDRGIDVYTGYGMSETCPVLTLAHLKPHMMDWDLERQIDIRCRTGLPIPNWCSTSSIRDGKRAARRPGHRRGGGALPLADPGLLEGSRAQRRAVARRLAAHRRRRFHRRGTAICRSPTGSRTSSSPAANGFPR